MPRVVGFAAARRRKLLADRHCRACGYQAANCHHLLGKGQRGDDVPENLIPLCGSGSHGCHGALHGNPYRAADGRRWDAGTVRREIGVKLRPDEIAYLTGKLGAVAAAEHVRRHYTYVASG